MNPIRKGDMCALRVQHSATAANFKITRYDAWHIVECAQATREGQVKRIRMANHQSHSVEVDQVGTVYSISPGRQAAARSLFVKLPYLHDAFETADLLKVAMLETITTL